MNKRIGGLLLQKMTSLQVLGIMQLVGEGFPSQVAVHDCGLARVIVCGNETHVDELGDVITTEAAAERKRLHEVNRPKRGRPRKTKLNE